MVDESPVTQCITILMNFGVPGVPYAQTHLVPLVSADFLFLIDRYTQHIPSDSLHWVRASPHYDVLCQLTP